MNLCVWCLTHTIERPTDVGPELGHQRDPYRRTIMLCTPCKTALVEGQVEEFHNRYRAERLVTRNLEQQD